MTSKTVEKALSKMKKKKSAGVDGLGQDQLVMGSPIISLALTSICNKSINEGQFPKDWKEALVTPVLKKGDPKLKENYRPVSCLPAASKLLEMLVCDQTTNFMESNKLLPENQHGFRAKRSTMSAWANLQREWTQNTDDKKVTGILLWDLSAAFDTLDADILVKKLELFGFVQKTRNWFYSFLTNRTQRVKIGRSMSPVSLVFHTIVT